MSFETRVYIAGAGPGDPGLITVKALECIKAADAIIYDHLCNEELLKFAKPGAEKIYVGKKASAHTLPQEKINELLVAEAKKGKKVVRLKGGDPFVFGRGGEECSGLAREGIAFEVVPGISSATAVPAYAGIPVTDRRHSSSVAIVTGHEDPGKESSAINWKMLSTAADTLVFLMGAGNLEAIAASLIKNGRAASTPSAVISCGTLPGQKSACSPLGEICAAAAGKGIRAPAVLVVGDVVKLRETISWFEKKPLFGRKIIVTRSREQASRLSEALAAAGAEAIEFPTIGIAPPDDYSSMDSAIEKLASGKTLLWDMIGFTSANGVKFFMDRVFEKGLDARALSGMKVCAMGSVTAGALRSYGIRADVVPDEFSSEGVASELAKTAAGCRVLLPRVKDAPALLREKLEAHGMKVSEVTAYAACLPCGESRALVSMLGRGDVDMITFASSKTAENFLEILGSESVRIVRDSGARIACIGPVTAKTVESAGLDVSVQPSRYTVPDMAEAIVEYYGGQE